MDSYPSLSITYKGLLGSQGAHEQRRVNALELKDKETSHLHTKPQDIRFTCHLLYIQYYTNL